MCYSCHEERKKDERYGIQIPCGIAIDLGDGPYKYYHLGVLKSDKIKMEEMKLKVSKITNYKKSLECSRNKLERRKHTQGCQHVSCCICGIYILQVLCIGLLVC